MNTAKWSKKMVFAVTVLVCATVLAHKGTISAEAWTELVKWVGGVYIIAQGTIDVIRPKAKAPDGGT